MNDARAALSAAGSSSDVLVHAGVDTPWLTVDELAELLAVGRDFVYQHAAELGGRRLGSGAKAPWRFRLEDVLEATSAAGHLPVEQVSFGSTVRRRRRGSGTGVPLLPIRGGQSGD